MTELDLLQSEEQTLLAAMKAVRLKREAALAEIATQDALAAQQRRDEVAARAAELKPITVLGLSYEKLRKIAQGTNVKFVRVHQDIRSLLIAALPSESEEQFCALVSTLSEQLMGYGSSWQQLKERISELKDSSATSHYFDPELQNSVVVVSCDGRMKGAKHELLADVLTTYSLKWGETTGFEERE